MLKLNLLPPKIKKEIEFVDLRHASTALFVWIFILLLSFTLILATIFVSLSILSRSQNKLIEEKRDNEEMQKILEIEEKIKTANKIITAIYDKQKNMVYWTPIFEELSKLVSGNMYLKSFNYRSNNNEIKLDGWADTRDRMLAFEQALKESQLFDEVETPLSNLLKKTNVDFSFTFKSIKKPLNKE